MTVSSTRRRVSKHLGPAWPSSFWPIWELGCNVTPFPAFGIVAQKWEGQSPKEFERDRARNRTEKEANRIGESRSTVLCSCPALKAAAGWRRYPISTAEASGVFLFLYFSKSFFIEIYFRFHNLQFCTPTARLRGGRVPAANWRGGRDLNINKIYF